ncbi:hypothetical protein J9303_14945 [Bacillaceae bacterium Marseille-Q3522]|nr:hypothetical protein [Bacillaceae bacterium Marseille-Q3522]
MLKVSNFNGKSLHGAKVEDIRLIKSVVGDELRIKASGGIRSLETAVALIEAGASRLGGTGGVAITNTAREILALS